MEDVQDHGSEIPIFELEANREYSEQKIYEKVRHVNQKGEIVPANGREKLEAELLAEKVSFLYDQTQEVYHQLSFLKHKLLSSFTRLQKLVIKN